LAETTTNLIITLVDMEAHKGRREQTEEYAGDVAAASIGATSKDNLSISSMTIALTAMQKAKEFDENFHVTENSMWALRNAVAKAKEADEKYHIADKTTVATNGALKQVASSINFISRSMWTKR
jgi:hypothetical protein